MRTYSPDLNPRPPVRTCTLSSDFACPYLRSCFMDGHSLHQQEGYRKGHSTEGIC